VELLIGASGFSYDDWKGTFYPRGIKQSEMLRFYARHFPAVEINSSYYGIPKPASTGRWTEQVPHGFEFVVKAHKDMTHSDRFVPNAFEDFRRAMRPLVREKMLGCVLAQFPWAFKPTPENKRYLKLVRDELPDAPLVVEFRNSGWAADETFELLRSLGIGFCCVDEPRFKALMKPVCFATSEIGYVRFHGRNYKKWFHHKEAKERYDYLYTRKELAEWVPKIETLAEETEKTYVFFNNHFKSHSTLNAKELAEMMGQTLPLAAAAAA